MDGRHGIGHLGELVEPIPSGSFVAIAGGCRDTNTAEADDIVGFWNEHGTPRIKYRGVEAITSLFDDLELIKPGVVPGNRWRPGPDDPGDDVNQFCGVALKA